jgi:hypothetical protein
VENIPYIFQMAIKYTIIFHSKALQNLPKFGFLFGNKPSSNPGIEFCCHMDVPTYVLLDFSQDGVRPAEAFKRFNASSNCQSNGHA